MEEGYESIKKLLLEQHEKKIKAMEQEIADLRSDMAFLQDYTVVDEECDSCKVEILGGAV